MFSISSKTPVTVNNGRQRLYVYGIRIRPDWNDNASLWLRGYEKDLSAVATQWNVTSDSQATFGLTYNEVVAITTARVQDANSRRNDS